MRLMTLVAITVLTTLVFLGPASAEDLQGERFVAAAEARSSITDQPIPPATDAHSARSLRAASVKTVSENKTTKALKSAVKHSEKRGLTTARKTKVKAASAKKTTNKKSKQKKNST